MHMVLDSFMGKQDKVIELLVLCGVECGHDGKCHCFSCSAELNVVK